MTPINFLDEGLKLLNFPPSLGKGLLNDKETLFTLLRPVLEEDQTLLINKIDKVKNTYLALNEKPSTETFQHFQSEVICLHLFISKLKKGKSIKIGKVKESFDKVIQTLDTNPDLFELDPSFLTGYFNTLSQFLKHPDLAHEQKPKAKNDLIRQIIILKQAIYSSLLRIKEEQYMPTVTDYEASIHITFHFEAKNNQLKEQLLVITNKLKNIQESSTEYKELLRKSNFIASDLAKEASKPVEDAYNLIQRLRTREVIPLIKFQEISESLKNCSNRLERFQEKINTQLT